MLEKPPGVIPPFNVLISIRVYRHLAVAISKKHLPALLKPFDAHTPNDYDGFLRLLAFQTGHKPTTHAGAYALETAFAAKLQADLICRYLENSRIWHQFLLVGQSDVIEAAVDSSYDRNKRTYEIAGYFPDPPRLRSDDDEECMSQTWSSAASDVEDGCESDQAGHQSHRGEVKRHRRRQGPLGELDKNISPVSKKIRRLQEKIEELKKARAL
ncbi:hypothetical protein M409DRAFT_31022 [Zasmidium cellare ATCC 36951]|uniref:Uncharacterized protein n=1 Tax=Zasmidium cellare ATCC 36951 TaxID=1080233 RepID=A0A6A6BUJ8_ZASCE|nr:uncharacterized protein M409DRAFT_31022 [Zasmidium cellare ATCC 36951]KAF2158467.1 hypothetical protein M409DRAFT_31022 [Zasmidium cellare ATCC 36951]